MLSKQYIGQAPRTIGASGLFCDTGTYVYCQAPTPMEKGVVSGRQLFF